MNSLLLKRITYVGKVIAGGTQHKRSQKQRIMVGIFTVRTKSCLTQQILRIKTFSHELSLPVVLNNLKIRVLAAKENF